MHRQIDHSSYNTLEHPTLDELASIVSSNALITWQGKYFGCAMLV